MLLTLLTDFGTSDTYVGQLKASVYAVAPRAVLVDLTHDVPPQGVRAGAFHLWTAMARLARPAVHLAVVDPGVGTERRAVAARSRQGHLFVGPDNGLLMPAIARTGGLAQAVELERPPGLSTTFHGRDLFAPAAARLLRGSALGRLGRPARELEERYELPARGPRGEVAHVDRFGNLITSLEAPARGAFTVEVKRRRIAGDARNTYGSVASGELVALAGSSGLIEVARRGGSAAALLHIAAGAPVRLVSGSSSTDRAPRRPGSAR